MAHPWDFGWDALVAIFTGSLACATFWLAWKTKTLADESAEQISAQARPMLVPVDGAADSEFPLSVDSYRVRLKITNAGGGPATDIIAELGDQEADTWHSGVIAPGATAILTFARAPDSDVEDNMTISLLYGDVAAVAYRSAFWIHRRPVIDSLAAAWLIESVRLET